MGQLRVNSKLLLTLGMQYVLAAGTCLEQAGLLGVRAPPPAQTAQRTAPDHGGAQLRWRCRRSRGGRLRWRRGPRDRKPGEIHLGNLPPEFGRQRAPLLPVQRPEGTPLETLAHVEGSRWRIETEFETEKSDIGLDEYETRSWAGWHHHVALCLLGGAFLLGLQQDWGKRCFSAAARRFSWERFARSLRREQEGFTILMRIDQ